MLLLQNYFDRRNITDSTVKKGVNDVKSEAENEDEIEKLPPEQLLSDVDKILESLAMKGVEIVHQPPTLRKRVLSMFIVVLSLLCMYVCMYHFYSRGITYAPDPWNQLDGAYVSERHADDPRRSNGLGQDAAIHRVYSVSSPFAR